MESVLLSRVAGRSIPMTGMDRSNLCRRTFLFLIVLLGMPLAAYSDTLEDSAKELARKIAIALPSRENVSCVTANASSLQPNDVARIDQALKSELQDRGTRTPTSDSAEISVLVTLSENVKDFIWIAEIRRADISRVVVEEVPRSAGSHSNPGRMPVVLQAEKFWEGAERILDGALISDPSGVHWRVLLLQNGLVIEDTASGAVSHVGIPSAQASTREPKGSLASLGSVVFATVEPKVCAVSLETRTLTECYSAVGPQNPRIQFDLRPAANAIPENARQALIVASACGKVSRFLVSGAGDDTQADYVQLFESQESHFFAVSDPLNFGGPVIALHANRDEPTAVVRNLNTGHYEAYRLSISCAQ